MYLTVVSTSCGKKKRIIDRFLPNTSNRQPQKGVIIRVLTQDILPIRETSVSVITRFKGVFSEMNSFIVEDGSADSSPNTALV